tara:strand:+ start:977 stop:1699 length:723 start_codon:yes stop_codon:yes gene_type:complete
MSDYDDTASVAMEDSSPSGDYSEPGTPESSDIDQAGAEGVDPGPIPYDRFKEVNDQLRDMRSNSESSEARIRDLQTRLDESARWSSWAWKELQSKQAQPEQQEEDPYEEPAERELRELRTEFNQFKSRTTQRQQQMQVEQAEREIMSEISSAKSRYPNMSELEVINHLTQNPHASVSALAKRSHERRINEMEDYARQRGYRPPPRALQRAAGAAPRVADFGDDLDAAERAALADFGPGDF